MYPPPIISLAFAGPGAGGAADSSGVASTTHVGTSRPSDKYSRRGIAFSPSVSRGTHFFTNTSTAGHDHGRTTEFASVRGSDTSGTFPRSTSGGCVA
jgi:hypothetical protein